MATGSAALRMANETMMNVPRPSALTLLFLLLACPLFVASFVLPDASTKKIGVKMSASRRGWLTGAASAIVSPSTKKIGASRREWLTEAASAIVATNVITLGQPEAAYAAGPDKARATDKCRDGARNCIRTAWVPPAGKTKADAIADIRSVVQSYPQKGQNGVDCNGWSFVEDKLDADGTARIEFYSCIGPAAVSMNLAKPFVDDVKLELIDGGSGKLRFELRSKSRVGASDYGVNKKRVNYLAEALRNKGWDAPKVVYGIGSYDALF